VWQLDASLSGSVFSVHENPPPDSIVVPPDLSGNRASGSLEAIRFLAPVVDDDAPRSLQPFLQRAGELYLSAGGGGFVTRNPGAPVDRTDSNLGLGLGMDVYLSRYFALTAGLGYGYDVLHDVGVDQATHSFSAHGGFGIRAGDARFDASYTFSANDVGGSFDPLRWGSVEITAYAVFDRRFTLNVWGVALQSGGGGGGEVGYYATRDFGFWMGAFGERGKLYTNDLVLNRYGGHAGLSYWFTPRLRLGVTYNLTIDDVPEQPLGQGTIGYHEVEHALTAAAALRLP
jgi:hypothetical protein